MNKIIYVVAITIFIFGCPATFNGLVKNESESSVVVIPPFEAEFTWTIESDSEEEISWYQRCIILKVANETQYYMGWPIPDNVVTHGIFSSSLNVVYNNEGLFFKKKNGQLIKIKRMDSCGTA